ncbi:HAD-IIA family hydrolase [Alkalihalophilus pseudofirmus]|uniref:HAD-IIA family hydrolase n=1 Tax=Alkalihalophilus pseudofirmus TaxID=79885 RepID=UPI00259B9435|nr:HAD-IIA family hydrolase [Alkalihalophilus pseudofirmus]WEG15398.1 HAD-IIA family hydrolase [Alkalihalophilus pseudofirmus]
MKDYKLFFFDLDGTLVNGNSLFPHANEVIQCLRRNKKSVFFLTNHPARPREELCERLINMGLELKVDELITPTLAIKRYFSARPSSSSIYVVGSELIKEEIRKMDIHVLDHSRETSIGEVFVVLGMSPNLNYEQLQEGFFLLQKGARLILLNPDICCPAESGMYLDTGAIARVYTSASPKPFIKPEVIGKPSIWMQQVLLDFAGSIRSKAVMVGDSITSDIAIGQAVGMDTVLLLSGVSKKEDLHTVRQRPTHVYSTLDEFYQKIKELTYV